MKRARASTALVVLVALIGCGGEGGGGSDGTAPQLTNSVAIERITPAAAPGGIETTFTVDVLYDLQTVDSALLAYCFMPASVNRCVLERDMLPLNVTIKWTKRGTATFTTTRTISEPQSVFVFLIEQPMLPGVLKLLDASGAYLDMSPAAPFIP